MFKIGCARWMTFGMLTTEIAVVAVAGIAIAGGLSWLVMVKIGISNGYRTSPAQAVSAGPVSARRVEATCRGRQLSVMVLHEVYCRGSREYHLSNPSRG